MGLYQNVLESADGGAFVNLRDSAGTGITSTLVSGKQGLDVNVINSFVIGVEDESAFTYGSSLFQPVGGVYNSAITALTSGQSGVVSLTAYRDMRVNLRDASGNELGDSNASGVWVRPGDGTNAQAYASSGEAFASIREGGNVAAVTAANELQVIDTNSGDILALMKPATSTLSQVAVAATSAVLLALNASRKGWSIQNVTNKIVYLAMAATATASAYTVAVQPNGYYEQMGSRVYTGIISVIGPSGVSGNAIVTEYS